VRPDLLCDYQENAHLCDDNRKAVGPIKLDIESEDPAEPVFFLTNREPLETERYEFHKSKLS
jgi:hypothetical protein